MGRSRRHARRSARQLRHSEHEGTRRVLRIVGPLVVALGLFFMVYGVYDFTQGFGNHRPPRGFPGFDRHGETVEVDEGGSKFWMCFLGVPLLGFGVMICRFAYLGAAARYVAGEVAPVASDTFTYMARTSKDGIRDVVGAVRGRDAGRRWGLDRVPRLRRAKRRGCKVLQRLRRPVSVRGHLPRPAAKRTTSTQTSAMAAGRDSRSGYRAACTTISIRPRNPIRVRDVGRTPGRHGATAYDDPLGLHRFDPTGAAATADRRPDGSAS